MRTSKSRKPAAESPAAPAERRRPITQSTIARKLGVSRATVSFVLNGRGEEFGISPDMRKRVLEVAKELMYVPNAMARSLKSQGTGTVAILVADFSFNWVHRLQLGIDRVLGPEGRLTPMFAPRGWDAARERREIDWFLQRRADAIVVCVPIPENLDYYRHITELGVPLLFFGDTLVEMPEANFVIWNAAPAVKLGMRHLYDIGRRRIGFFGVGESTRMTLTRHQAYLDSMEELGLPRDPRWEFMDTVTHLGREQGSWRATFLHELIHRLVLAPTPRPDAMFSLNDALVLALLDKLLDAPECRIPEDLAIVGVGDLPIFGPRGERFTTLHEPLEEMGQQTAHAVLRLLDDTSSEPQQIIVEHSQLLIRETTIPRGMPIPPPPPSLEALLHPARKRAPRRGK